MTFENTNFINAIFSLTLYYHCIQVECETFPFEPLNLKTVLFKETDLVFRCWSMSEIVLLRHRKVLQDLVPRKIPKDFSLLLQYLKHLERAATKMATGKNQRLLMLALGDIIGGYLQAVVIPITNKAYYAGNVDFTTISQLHQMFNMWKWHLSTDGGMWSHEVDLHITPSVTLLNITLDNSEAACEELHVGPKNMVSESTRISIPYLDNDLTPSAIALPLKQKNLYSLLEPTSAHILLKYYSLSMKCLAGKETDVVAFNNYFHKWITSKVVPHLNKQDHWFPAFGAVMRTIETIEARGFTSVNTFCGLPTNDHKLDNALKTDQGIKEETKENTVTMNYLGDTRLNLIVVGAVSVFTVLCIFHFLCRRNKKIPKLKIVFDNISDEKALNDTVKSLYYNVKHSLRLNGSKTTCGFYEEHFNAVNQLNNMVVCSYPTPLREIQTETQTGTSECEFMSTKLWIQYDKEYG